MRAVRNWQSVDPLWGYWSEIASWSELMFGNLLRINEGSNVADTAAVQFQICDSLPDGILVLPMEKDGELVWLVARGHMSPEAVEAVNRQLRHFTDHGLWQQLWGEDNLPRPRPYAWAS